jgi:hypothetical protein
VGLVQVDTNNRTQVRQFLRLPFDLHRDVPQWVPPLAPDATDAGSSPPSFLSEFRSGLLSGG